MNLAQQTHLDYTNRVNMGAYYTQDRYVGVVWDMINPHIDAQTKVMDTSCGYGNFLNYPFAGKKIGNDIDGLAIDKAMQNTDTTFFNKNALNCVARHQYNIGESDKLCIIGNPPYNDRSSIIRSSIKSFNMAIDDDIQTRDLGMSFLLSYAKLQADFICVLHPLSYLIKPSNFKLLKKFTSQYQLKQANIISSGGFNHASKSIQFPIVIALYEKSKLGTSYADVINFSWRVDNKSFKLSDFDDVSNYVQKYPNKYQQAKEGDLLFWTMRDINALKRNQTFVHKANTNTVIIDRKQLDYYIYVDVFKQFSHRVPYYFGNCNVLIDDNLFKKYKKYFILEALTRHQHLEKHIDDEIDFSNIEAAKQKINEYFKKMLGIHYEN